MLESLLLAALLSTGLAMPAIKQRAAEASLARLMVAVEKLNISGADKLDALYFAVRGRLASGREHWWMEHRFGNKLTAEQLRAFATPYSVPNWGPSVPPGATPIYRKGVYGFGDHSGGIVGYYYPVRSPAEVISTALFGPGFIPNALALPPEAWYPPGSSEPLPRLGRSVAFPQKP
jgi:hypothetical protein